MVDTWCAVEMAGNDKGSIPKELQEAVLLSSQPMPVDSVQVKGHDYSEARSRTDL